MDSAYYPSGSQPSPPKLVQVPKTALLAAAAIVALSGVISILAAIKSCSKTSAPAPVASASPAASASAQGLASAAASGSAAPPEPTAESLAPPPTAPAAPEVTTPFSVKAARNALNTTGREVAKCRRTKLWGVGEASVTFANDGTVSHVVIGAPFRGTPSGECVSGVMSAVQVAPFAGKPATINYKFFIPIK